MALHVLTFRLAYRSGVTKAVAFPISSSLVSGLSYAFSTSAEHGLSQNAILNPDAALHLSLASGKMSTSTQLAILRRLLTSDANNETEIWNVLDQAKHGERRVVIEVDSADDIASLIRLKRDWAPGMKLTIMGGQESWMASLGLLFLRSARSYANNHQVADELAREDIGVIITHPRAFPFDWNSRRIMPGPPLSNHTLASYLTSHGVVSHL